MVKQSGSQQIRKKEALETFQPMQWEASNFGDWVTEWQGDN